MAFRYGALKRVNSLTIHRSCLRGNVLTRPSSLHWPRNFSGSPACSFKENYERFSRNQPDEFVKPEDQEPFERRDGKVTSPGGEHATGLEAKDRKKRRLWSSSERSQLIEMLANGKTHEEMSETLDRTPEAITSAVYSNGLARRIFPFTLDEDQSILAAGTSNSGWKILHDKLPHHSIQSLARRFNLLLKDDTLIKAPIVKVSKRPFTAEEDERIKKLRSQRMSWTDIANDLPGARHPDSIRVRYRRLLPNKEDQVSVKRLGLWGENEIEQLRQMVDAGHSRKEIGAALGRSYKAVLSKIDRMSVLNHQSAAPRPPKQKRWTEQAVEQLVELDASRKYSSGEIAQMLNKTHGAITTKLSSLGLKRKGARNNCSPRKRKTDVRVDGVDRPRHEKES